MHTICVPLRHSLNVLIKWFPCVRHYTKNWMSESDTVPTFMNLIIKIHPKCTYHLECFIRIPSLQHGGFCLFVLYMSEEILADFTAAKHIIPNSKNWTSFLAVWLCSYPGPCLEGHHAWCNAVKMCNNFRARRPHISFCTGPCKLCSLF